MTHASVFSGIGGPEVAATMLGWENLFHCEINPFGRAVLDYWYPNSKSYEDITTTDFTEWRGRVNVLTGGFPCQPFSYAGKRGGATDDRYLWPYMFRCIDQVRPDWVVAENVAGITTMVEQGEVSEMASQATLFNEDNNLRRYQLRETFTLQRICTDLEGYGYAVQPVLIPACAVGAPHRRDRVFIVARRKGEADVLNADTYRHDKGGFRESGTAEGERNHDDIQPCEQSRRDGQTSRATDIHGILRTSTNTRSGGQSAPEQQGKRERTEVQQQSREQSQYGTGRPGDIQYAPYPYSHRGCEVDEHMESELADGAKPLSNGGQRNVADTDSKRLSQRMPGRECEDAAQGRAGVDDATQRLSNGGGDSEMWRIQSRRTLGKLPVCLPCSQRK